MVEKPANFREELKRRRVIRVIHVYAAAAFVILELVDIIAEPFELPGWAMKLVFVLLCMAYGAMDAILLHLSIIQNLRVIARVSVERYSKSGKTIKEIGKELNVGCILEARSRKKTFPLWWVTLFKNDPLSTVSGVKNGSCKL
ncbi:MAG TPA: hypothetical protein ENH59_04085 [Bacteroidetes bacterium]|nr:hypothetical protein [Bacteroidota bacterium]